MTTSDYRDMYYAISNGIEIGVSADSVLEEMVSERKSGHLSSEEYKDLIAFFKCCDQKSGAKTVEHNHAVWQYSQNEIEQKIKRTEDEQISCLYEEYEKDDYSTVEDIPFSAYQDISNRKTRYRTELLNQTPETKHKSHYTMSFSKRKNAKHFAPRKES